MYSRQLVMSKQSLDTTSIRNSDTSRIRMSHYSGLKNTRNRVTDTIVDFRTTEKPGTPLYERFHDVDLRRQRQDGDLLCPEMHNRNTVIGTADVTTDAVHGSDGGVAFHHGEDKAADSHCAAYDPPDGLGQRGLGRGRFFKGA